MRRAEGEQPTSLRPNLSVRLEKSHLAIFQTDSVKLRMLTYRYFACFFSLVDKLRRLTMADTRRPTIVASYSIN